MRTSFSLNQCEVKCKWKLLPRHEYLNNTSGLISCVRRMCVGVDLSVSFHGLYQHWNVIPCLVRFTKNIAWDFQIWPSNQFSSEKSIGSGPKAFNLYDQVFGSLSREMNYLHSLASKSLWLRIKVTAKPYWTVMCFSTLKCQHGGWPAVQNTREAIAIWYLVPVWLELLSAGLNAVILNRLIWSNMHD